MSKPKIAVVIGSTRPTRFADKPAQWIADLARESGEFDVEIVDLRDFPLPFFEDAKSPAWGPTDNAVAQRWQAKIDTFDGFVFTAAEYNHGPTAVLKNALDYAYPQWAKKVAAFVGYGGVGGARAVEQLRLHAVELQMTPIRHAVHIVLPDFVAIMQGKPIGEINHLNEAGREMLKQLGWWSRALKVARNADDTQAQAA